MKKIIIAMMFACVAGSYVGVQSAQASEEKAKVTTIHLTKDEFLKKVVNYEADPKGWKYLGDKPALIDFYADWCGPCKTIAPILEELAAEYGDEIVIYKINTQDEPDLAAQFDVRAIPALLFIPMEGQPHMTKGSRPKERFKVEIDSLLLLKK